MRLNFRKILAIPAPSSKRSMPFSSADVPTGMSYSEKKHISSLKNGSGIDEVLRKSSRSHDNSTPSFGFWLYLMTDAVLFASFFAVFAVMRNNTYGGPDGAHLFDMQFVLVESIILLTSSFVCGLAILSAKQQKLRRTVGLLALTGLLGVAFLSMEIAEFSKLIADGDSWRASGFLTSFFGLVSLHGFHVSVGVLWLAVLFVLIKKRGLIESTIKRIEMFSVYWHFLDLVWIFIFTFVYAMGVIK